MYIKAVVIGLGEVGRPLYEILNKSTNTFGYDRPNGNFEAETTSDLDQSLIKSKGCILHICIPYTSDFIGIVDKYQKLYEPSVTVVHSTVPIGTTSKIRNAVHSPVLGRHDDMERSIRSYTKWIGGDNQLCQVVGGQLYNAGIKCRYVSTPDETEAHKQMCLAKYGMSIAFAKYQKQVCDRLNISYDHVLEWDQNYNEHVAEHLRRPLIEVDEKPIGGHCIIPGVEKLQAQYPNKILDEILTYGPLDTHNTHTIWQPSNIYPTAKIGKNVKVGAFTEIGNKVTIGDDVSIGAHCFIPEGVTICEKAWIGPRVTFTNDRFPPSGRDNWELTKVMQGARVGASCTILPGVTIGEKALIGAGSTVTKDVPAGETWAGNPAQKLIKTEAS